MRLHCQREQRKRELALLNIPIDRYSAGSIEMLKREVLCWRAQLYFAADEQLGGISDRDADLDVIEVNLITPEVMEVPKLTS
jgi:hypothetical protein